MYVCVLVTIDQILAKILPKHERESAFRIQIRRKSLKESSELQDRAFFDNFSLVRVCPL